MEPEIHREPSYNVYKLNQFPDGYNINFNRIDRRQIQAFIWKPIRTLVYNLDMLVAFTWWVMGCLSFYIKLLVEIVMPSAHVSSVRRHFSTQYPSNPMRNFDRTTTFQPIKCFWLSRTLNMVSIKKKEITQSRMFEKPYDIPRYRR